jgi:hypothetical protein
MASACYHLCFYPDTLFLLTHFYHEIEEKAAFFDCCVVSVCPFKLFDPVNLFS